MSLTQRYLVLSTAHLSETTRRWLRESSVEQGRTDGHRWVDCGGDDVLAYPHTHGWFVCADRIDPLVAAGFDKRDLLACITAAHRQNCTWLNFDDGAPVDQTLKVYEDIEFEVDS